MKILLAGLVILWTASSAFADPSTLFDWNAPGDSGHNFTGWTWTSNADGYNNRGWKRNDAVDYGGGGDWRPRSFIKDDSGDGTGLTDASIDATQRAPSTSTGGSLKLT